MLAELWMTVLASSAKARCPPIAPMAAAPSGVLRVPSAREMPKLNKSVIKIRNRLFLLFNIGCLVIYLDEGQLHTGSHDSLFESGMTTKMYCILYCPVL